jgi:hypothetical protein
MDHGHEAVAAVDRQHVRHVLCQREQMLELRNRDVGVPDFTNCADPCSRLTGLRWVDAEL